jgi:hypothetical protein
LYVDDLFFLKGQLNFYPRVVLDIYPETLSTKLIIEKKIDTKCFYWNISSNSVIILFVSGSLRELYALAASQQPLASLVNQQQRLLFRHYDIAQHVLHQQQGAVSKLLGKFC